MTGHVDSIRITDEASAPMRSVESVRAVPGGLEGDRYATGAGYYAPMDVCEVTFIAGEDLDYLLDARFRVGEAVFEGTRRRPPCKHVEEVAGEGGVMRALRGKGGICADVVEPGEVELGDGVEVLEELSFDGEGLAEAMRSRHE